MIYKKNEMQFINFTNKYHCVCYLLKYLFVSFLLYLRYMSRKNKPNQGNLTSNNLKVEMVTSDTMTDEQRRAIFEREATVDAIPDLDVLTGHIYDILTYLDKPATRQLIEENRTAVMMNLNNKYADSVPYGILTLLMEDEEREKNIEMLLKMFESLRNIKMGNLSIEEGEQQLNEEVCERYEYSKYGSKKAFEQALMQEVKKEQEKKRNKNVEDIRKLGKPTIKK
jgi:hypothetical protein